MRFFTPELYVQFNSSDNEAADRADQTWEKALQEYQRHLDAIRHEMPSQVQKVAELCPHDAEVLGFERDLPTFWHPFGQFRPFCHATAILSLTRGGTILFLIYMLGDSVREHAVKADWPFSKLRKHWLYDEVDVVGCPEKMFLHRILFSDGSVVEIPFVSVIVSSVPLPANEEGVARHIS